MSGRVVEADGQPPRNVTVWIGGESDGGFSAETCQVEPDGRFVSGELSPGTSVLDASSLTGASDMAVATSGFAVVTVKEPDVSGVVLTLHPSTTIQGPHPIRIRA